MQTALYALCALLWVAALTLFFTMIGTQILGAILGVAGMVAFVGAAIVGQLEDINYRLKHPGVKL